MLDVGNKPYLHRYSGALPLFQQDSPSPRYMQMRLSLGGWEELKKDLKALPKSFYTEAEWMPQCMATKTGGTELDRAAADNFYRVNQWNFLLIGEEGTGIFFHNDHLSAASWQAQIVGRKRWILCPYEQRRLFSSQMNPFDPDYGAHPDFARGYCADVTVEPGEIVYYPAYWWHATRNLDTPTMGITGLMVGNEDDRPDLPHPRVHEQFVADITHKCSKCWDLSKGPGQRRKCDDISERWPGAAPPISYDFCKTYLPRCQALWEDKEARDAQLRAAAEGGLMPIPEFDDILRRFVVPVTDLHVNAKVHDAEDLQKLQKAANAEVTTAARLVSEWGGDPAALPKDGETCVDSRRWA
uniref:JmjC domain-containing protein n=2 Tax=Phaeomonas parva TaxID=124430 RepID=A0A7S1Y0S4_9STRA|mmetsp:Transcript_903/g.2454  ORF Transcript_903/g.2454 Transcript_903/m.2454 type:complete len:355 (+) Transcript_903:236-1300(+)